MTARRRSLLVAAFVAGIVASELVAGCGGTLQAPAVPVRPFGEDLVALLPSGADTVLDVDVEQLRQWEPARRFVALLPDSLRLELARRQIDPLTTLDGMAVSIAQAGGAEPRVTMVVRGDLDATKVRALLATSGEVCDEDYRNVTVSQAGSAALARIAPRIFAFGSPADVRRVVDVARSESDSLRASASDHALQAALARAPTAKSGRPAIMAAVIPTDAVRQRLRAVGAIATLDWITVSLAIGDGFDVGAIGGVVGPAEARALVASSKAELAELAGRISVKMLGLRPLLDPVVLVAAGAEIHLAYRLPAPRVELLLAKLESLQALTHASRLTGEAPGGHP